MTERLMECDWTTNIFLLAQDVRYLSQDARNLAQDARTTVYFA